MPSAFLTVQFVVVAMLAAVGILTLGRWLKGTEYRYWSTAWLAWAVGAACLSLCPVWAEATVILLIVHTVAYAVFGSLLAMGALATLKSQELHYALVRSRHRIFLAVMVVITGLSIAWRWSGISSVVDFWQERHFWSGPWLVGYSFFTIWVISKHKSRWNLRPPIVLFVLALLLLATLEGVVTGVLFGYEGRLSVTMERFLEYLLYLEPIFLGFLALTMHGMLVDQLVHHLERNLVSSSRQSAKLKRLAERDPLTAVLNRHAFYSLLGAAREEKRRPLGGSVAVIDIDNLKPMNDTYGHVAGDAAIRAVAKAVRSLIRAEDLLFRWGGDEFLVILPQVEIEEAKNRLQKLDNLLAKVPLPGVEHSVAISLSVGISEFSPAFSLEQAIEDADEKMYALKMGKKAV